MLVTHLLRRSSLFNKDSIVFTSGNWLEINNVGDTESSVGLLDNLLGIVSHSRNNNVLQLALDYIKHKINNEGGTFVAPIFSNPSRRVPVETFRAWRHQCISLIYIKAK